MTASARFVASAAESTSKPAFSARSAFGVPGTSLTTTVTPRVAQVLRVGVTLAAEADDGDGLAGEQAEIGVLVVVHAMSLLWTALRAGCTQEG